MSAYSWSQQYVVQDAVADSPEIEVGEAEFGRVYCPAGTTTGNLTFFASPYSVTDTQNTAAYEACHDSSGAIALAIAADECHQIPADVLAGTRFLKIVAASGDGETLSLSFSD